MRVAVEQGVDALTVRAVARAAREAGLSACVNDTLARLVEAREQLLSPGDGGGAIPTK